MIFGMRLFHTGPFHAGCGPSVKVSAILAEIYEATALRGNAMLPRNTSLAAMVYEDALELKRGPIST